jgi:hypothetical protein
MHRVTWDFRHQPLPGGGGRGGLPIAAVPMNTVASPNAPWAAAGQYMVRLTVDGSSYTQPLTLKMDPRVKTLPSILAAQDRLAKSLYDGARDAQSALQQVRALRAAVVQARERAGQAPAAGALDTFGQKLVALEGAAEGLRGRGGAGGGGGAGGRGGAGGGPDSLANIGGSLMSVVSLIQGADAPATTQVLAAATERRAALTTLLGRWKAVSTTDRAALNAVLVKAGLAPVK